MSVDEAGWGRASGKLGEWVTKMTAEREDKTTTVTPPYPPT